MKNEICKIVVPSYNRPKDVITTRVVANCTLCVRASQVSEYKKHNPDVEIVACPDNVKGIIGTRQWIIENFPAVLMLDDDISAVVRAMNPSKYAEIRNRNPDIPDHDKLTPDEAYAVIQQVADVAKQLGAYLWGFTAAQIVRDVKPQEPFSANTYINGTQMGVFAGGGMSFPVEDDDAGLCEDYYLNCINAYKNRFSFVDNRFLFISKTFSTSGGCADFRTVQKEERAYKYLRAKFGDAIRKKGDVTNINGKLRNKTHPWERSLCIPF